MATKVYIVVLNKEGEQMFLLTNNGKATWPGGMVVNNDPQESALSILEDQANLIFEKDVDWIDMLRIRNTSYFLARPFEGLRVMPREDYKGFVYCKPYETDGKWYVTGGIPLHEDFVPSFGQATIKEMLTRGKIVTKHVVVNPVTFKREVETSFKDL